MLQFDDVGISVSHPGIVEVTVAAIAFTIVTADAFGARKARDHAHR